MLVPFLASTLIGSVLGPQEHPPRSVPPSSSAQEPRQDQATLVIYDIHDLVEDPQQVAQAQQGERSGIGDPAAPPSVAAMIDLLVSDLLATNPPVGSLPATRQERSVGTLVVEAPAATHERVRALLTFLRQEADPLVDLDVRVMSSNADLDRWLIGVGLRIPAESIGPVLPYECDAEFTASLLKAAETLEAALITAPRVLTLPRQRATVQVVSEEAFVNRYMERLVSDGALVVDPEIEVLEEGVILGVGAAFGLPDSEGRSVCAVQLSSLITRIERPIPVVETVHGPVHVPVVHRQQFATTALLHPGTVLLLVGPPTAANGEPALATRLLLLIEVRQVPRQAFDPNDPKDGAGRKR